MRLASLTYLFITDMNYDNTFSLIDGRYDAALADLHTFLSFPSVSTAPQHRADVRACAQWLADKCSSIGLENVQILDTEGHPAVYAEWMKAPGAPTVLFYGHYDVQPPEPLELWTTPPFRPEIRGENIFARGAVDDKGQVWLHLAAVAALLADGGSLPVNYKVIIEGEEEIGSPNLDGLLRRHAELLRCDTVLVSDTSMYAPGVPSIVYGLRGLAYMQIDVEGPNRDLHSGSFGGAVPNPGNALAGIIAKLKDDSGKILVDGFYDDVRPLEDSERALLAQLPFNEEEFRAEVGIESIDGEEGYTPTERLGARPTLDVNGLLCGFTGEGAKTVLPAKAMAKVSMRLVPDQSTDDIARKFEEYVKKVAPSSVRVTVTALHGGDPAIVATDSPGVAAASAALRTVWGRDPLFVREGGSIPIALLFDRILAVPTVFMGFGLKTENLHSPDEHFNLQNFRDGMKATAAFFFEYARLHS